MSRTHFRAGVMDLGLHTRIVPDLSFRIHRALAAAGGAESLWAVDHLIGVAPSSIWNTAHAGVARLIPRIDAHYEPWTSLGYLAARNRHPRLRLGVGVTDAGRRNPAVTAQAAATLHLLTGGRAILGMGPGERGNNTPYGVNWDTPVARFEEALATIRLLWDSAGAPVSRESAFYPLREAVFDVPPCRGTRPEIWIAAHGPRMLRAAGKYADAWFPAFGDQPSEYAARLERIRTAASDAGRDPMAIIPAGLFPMLCGRTRADVEELVESVPVKALALLAPADVWARHGVEHPLGPTFAGLQDILPQTLDEATVLSYAEKTPAALVREYYLTGTPTEILERMAEWRDHGVRYAIALNGGPFRKDLTAGMLSNLPFVRILRRLRKL